MSTSIQPYQGSYLTPAFEGLTAADLAAGEAVTVESSLPLTDAARLMDERGAAHLVVAEGDRPVGVVSTLDIAGVLAWGRG